MVINSRKMFLFVFLIKSLLAEPELIETVDLSYGKFDAYFMEPLEIEEVKFSLSQTRFFENRRKPETKLSKLVMN